MLLARGGWQRVGGRVFVLGVILLLIYATLPTLSGISESVVLFAQRMARHDAYVFYATEDEYACSVAVNIHRLRHVFNTKHRVIVLVSSGVSMEYRAIFSELGATVFEEKPPPLAPGSVEYYENCLLKMLAFKIHELDPSVRRVLTLDSDQLIVKNIDSVFDSPSADIATPPAYWLGNSTLSSTCMLIEPSPRLWDQVREALASVLPDKYDMDIINEQFKDSAHRLPGSYITVNSHWEDRNVPSWFVGNESAPSSNSESARPASDEELEELYTQSHVIHFFAIGKPWSMTTMGAKNARPNAHPLLFQQWAEWRSTASKLCPGDRIDVV